MVQIRTSASHRERPLKRMAWTGVILPAISRKMPATSARSRKSRAGPRPRQVIGAAQNQKENRGTRHHCQTGRSHPIPPSTPNQQYCHRREYKCPEHMAERTQWFTTSWQRKDGDFIDERRVHSVSSFARIRYCWGWSSGRKLPQQPKSDSRSSFKLSGAWRITAVLPTPKTAKLQSLHQHCFLTVLCAEESGLYNRAFR